MKRRVFIAGAATVAAGALLPPGSLAQTKRTVPQMPEFSTNARVTTDVTLSFMQQIYDYSRAQHYEAMNVKNFTTFEGDDKLEKFTAFLAEPHYPSHIRVVGDSRHSSVQRMQASLTNYYTRSFVALYGDLMSNFIEGKMKRDYLKLKLNAAWFDDRAKVWEERFAKIENGYKEAVKLLPMMYEARIHRFERDEQLRRAMTQDKYPNDMGVFGLYESQVLEAGGLKPLFTPAWDNALDILRTYIKGGRDGVVNLLEKKVTLLEGKYEKAFQKYKEITGVIRATPVSHSEQIDPIISCDAEIFKHLSNFIDNSKALIKEYRKGGKYYRLIHNDPNYCPEAFSAQAWNTIEGDRIPNYKSNIRFMRQDLDRERKEWVEKLNAFWDKARGK